MRLFAAVPVPPPGRDTLARFLARMRTSDWPVRWVNDGALHLTLKFYGDVESAAEEAIAGLLRDTVRGERPMAMNCNGLGTFPGTERARVIWIGIDAPPALELLQHRVEQASAALGYPVEGRAFRPHVTLGRVKDGARLPAGALEGVQIDDVPFLASELVLFESRPGPDGARYTERQVARFDA